MASEYGRMNFFDGVTVGCMIQEDLSPHVRGQGEPPRWRTSAVVWHGEGWAPPCDIAQDTSHVHDNHNSIHTSSVVTRNKDCAFRCWPSGRRWKVCDWLTKITRCQKQHHYRHLEREITGRSRKSWRTNTRNEEIPMEHPWTLWSTLEKLWWNIYSRRPQALFQWPWRQTWAWSWIPHSQRHCECHHGMPPVSSWLITICLKASRFNITIIQAYAPTTDYDNDTEDFYDQLQEVIDQTPKKDILVVQGDWNAKIGEDASKNWKGKCGQYCNPETNERGLRLLEFASYNNLKVVNTFGPHIPSRHWTWHSPGGDYHNQID